MMTMAATSTGLELMEPASPEALLPDHAWWPWVTVIAVVLLVVLLLGLRKKKSPAVSPAAIHRAAYAKALAAIDQITTTDARAAAVQCSLILRQYLAATTADPALYETNEEFAARHDALPTFTAATRVAATACFNNLAAVKYAPGQPAVTSAEITAQVGDMLETLHHGFAA